MPTYLIKQIPDDYADATGLAKYNRSRMPGCKDIFQAYYDETTGIYKTGLTEDLITLYSKNGKDYSETSNFWSEFRVAIEADKPKIFNSDNLLDNISLKMLIANKYVAPDKESVNKVEYREAQYYAYTEESEIKEEISSRKKRDKAVSILLDISDNKEKMLLYGQYLEGIKYSPKFTEGTLYKMLRAFIEDKDINNTLNFLSVVSKPIEDLQQKIIIDKAIKQRLVQKVNIGNKKQVYQFGQTTIGSNLEEVYKNLTSPDFAPELLAIIKQLENK